MNPVIYRRGDRFSRIFSGRENVKLPFVVMILLLILATLLVFTGNDAKKSGAMPELLNQKWNSFDSMVKLIPTVELRNGTNLIWQIPDSPKAVLFLAHGCNGRAANFWDKSVRCPDCVGLPEERLIVLHALARKFAVIAISSSGRCWSFREERLIVKDIIKWWIAKQKFEKLPLVALGASSGGYFVSSLATNLKFSSITLMIAEGLFGQIDIEPTYPPTLFVHMPKDGARKERIDKYLITLKKKGIDVAEIKCMEFPLSSSLFADRIPGLGRSTSAALFNLLKEKGFIDKKGYMKYDGRRTRWREAQENNVTLPSNSLTNHIQEEMNLAFSYHEMTSLQSEQIFDWFESHMS
ncbi:guanyl-nucleotide exchange factor [Lithospermum erythrorhizon]|uniref:Guanyl-nucleotide exchange factor n=1 Tax=Lithospermum erythrorhizon TaxID=34254 RepID=A0AAV3PRT4_LITER